MLEFSYRATTSDRREEETGSHAETFSKEKQTKPRPVCPMNSDFPSPPAVPAARGSSQRSPHCHPRSGCPLRNQSLRRMHSVSLIRPNLGHGILMFVTVQQL